MAYTNGILKLASPRISGRVLVTIVRQHTKIKDQPWNIEEEEALVSAFTELDSED